MNFESLVSHISAIQDTLQAQAAHSVNLALTSRSGLMGCYIVEFETEIRRSVTAELQMVSETANKDWKLAAEKLFNRLSSTHLNAISAIHNPPIGILLCSEKGDTLVKYATAGLDPNIFVQKYMVQLPSEEEIKRFISKEIM